jgi:hypothetical protein
VIDRGRGLRHPAPPIGLDAASLNITGSASSDVSAASTDVDTQQWTKR